MTIEEAMMDNIVTFTFTKVDGSHRIASGTRDLNLIPKAFHPKGTGKTDVPGIIKFFDWNKQAWRSCRKSSIFGKWDIKEKHLIYRIDKYKELEENERKDHKKLS